MIASNTARAVL